MTKDEALALVTKFAIGCMYGTSKHRNDAAAPILAALTAQPAAPAVVEWMPIETAPKDGTTVLLWEKYSDAPIVGYYAERRAKWYADKEHYDTDGNACVVDKLIQDMLTHWMPLPPPPEDSSALGGKVAA